MVGEDMQTRERQRQIAEAERNEKRLAAWRERRRAATETREQQLRTAS